MTSDKTIPSLSGSESSSPRTSHPVTDPILNVSVEKDTPPLARTARIIATWFGFGFAPKASGTVTSLTVLPLAYLVHVQFGNVGILACAMLAFFIGWWASTIYLYTSKSMDTDPSEITIDEVAGQLIILSALMPTWQSYLVGFICFRFFDIVKPWPVGAIDRKMKSALGTMLDDVIAGFYPVALLLIGCTIGYYLDLPDFMVPLVQWLGGNYGL